MTIASLRGTSGAGKTHLARALLESPLYGQRVDVMDGCPNWLGGVKYTDGVRRKPLLHVLCPRQSDQRPLALMGSYASPTGGCDTISGTDAMFKLARDLHDDGLDVFMEGLLVSAVQGRTVELHRDGYPVSLFYLNTPLQECIDSVDRRRAEAGNTRPLLGKDLRSRWRALRLHPPRMVAAGIDCRVGSREEARLWLIELGWLAS